MLVDEQLKSFSQELVGSVTFCQGTHNLGLVHYESGVNTRHFQKVSNKLHSENITDILNKHMN